MSKKTTFTTITPIPPGLSRETVMSTLRNHVEMIDLNPLVIERFPVKAPSFATPEEYHAIWYEIVDRVTYLPGGLAKGNVHYNACFHDLAEGLQTHCYAPLGLDIRSRWTMGGSLPGEPAAPVEMGLNIPRQGLYLREDVQMKCNIILTNFVKKNLRNAHSTLVDRMVEKGKIVEVGKSNASLAFDPSMHRQSTAVSTYSSTAPSTPAMSMATPNSQHAHLSVASDGSHNGPYGARTSPQYSNPRMAIDPAYAAHSVAHNPAYHYPPAAAYGHPGYGYPPPQHGHPSPAKVNVEPHNGAPTAAIELPAQEDPKPPAPLELQG